MTETLRHVLEASPFAAVSIFFAYETVAIITGWSPTISKIIAYEVDIHPPVIIAAEAFIAGVILTGLAFHFGNALSWWRP